MLEISETACQHCEAERAQREEIDFRVKYALALISGMSLIGGILIDVFTSIGYVPVILFLISILSAGRWIIPNGIRSIIKVHLGITFLMTVAAIGAVLIGEPAEGAAVMFLFYLAEILEEKAGDRARTEIQSLMELEPPSVTVMEDGQEVYKSPDGVKIGEKIVIKPGDRIGMDGVVVKGESHVNQASITGESKPVRKVVGNQAYAGTLNQEGYLEIKVTKEAKNTLLAKIVETVKGAREKKAKTERFVSRFSHYYTPVVVLGSFLLGLGTFLLGAGIVAAVYRALTLLVISCPCAFALSIPVSMVSTIAGSAREGILVKGGEYIEATSKAKTVVFDKTGTLTEGKLRVSNICVHNQNDKTDVLRVASSLEQYSEHPIAKAIMEETENSQAKVPPADTFSSVPGKGIVGTYSSSDYAVGSRQLMEDEGVVLVNQETHSCGQGTLVYVSQDGKHIGTLVLKDILRPSAKVAIDQLKGKGIKTVILTGDNQEVAQSVSAEVGADDFKANMLPNEKVEAVKEIRRNGTVIMVGDGVNDAPALATADVGIAMGAISSDVAIETADIALMDTDLTKVPLLIERAKRTMSIVRNNVGLSISLKAVLGSLSILGLMSLWLAIALGDMGLTMLVIANAFRLTMKTKSTA
ncbi:cation-translocating P-type ATPase [Candidatus Thorarchaeota archaeon]|nr:MAG: cation-translocating P-type ATPase [Candidatus Thorarchaeota archaeon]